MDFIALLKQRRSVRHFNPNAEISRAELEELVNAACRAPSSNNSQPWRIAAITKRTLREKLLPIAYNQRQVMDASAVLIIFADRAAYEAGNLARIHNGQYEHGCFDEGTRDFLIQAATQFYRSHDEAALQKMRGLDIGLMAMSLMLAAEVRGWQSVPMTGYFPDRLRCEFAIPGRYEDVMMLAIGKATRAGHETLRRDAAEVLLWNEMPKQAAMRKEAT